GGRDETMRYAASPTAPTAAASGPQRSQRRRTSRLRSGFTQVGNPCTSNQRSFPTNPGRDAAFGNPHTVDTAPRSGASYSSPAGETRRARAGMTGGRAEGRGFQAAAGERLGQPRVEEELAVAVPAVVPVAVASLRLRVRVAGVEHHLDDVRSAGAEMIERGEEAVAVEPAACLEEADRREADRAVALAAPRPPPRARPDRVHACAE